MLADLVSRHTTKILKQYGSLNLSQWRVLAAVAEIEGRTAASVVQVTPMDKGIVSRAVASLKHDGLILKKPDSSDRRRSELFLTEKGRDQYQEINLALRKAIEPDEALNRYLKQRISYLHRKIRN